MDLPSKEIHVPRLAFPPRTEFTELAQLQSTLQDLGCGVIPGSRVRIDTGYTTHTMAIFTCSFLWYKRVGICEFPRGKFSRFFSFPETNSAHLKMNENSMVSNRNLQTSRGGKKSGSMLNFRGMTLSKYLPLHHL